MMKRSIPFWTLLAVVLGTSSLFAQVEKGPEKGADTNTLLRELRDAISDLKKRIDAVPTEQSIDSQIRRTLAVDLDSLRLQVDQLQREVAALKGLKPRVANYPTPAGRIQLVNEFPAPMTVIVNDKSYRLAAAGQPGDRRLLENQPAGTFTYQVLGVQMDLVSRILTPTETFTITVYPR